MRVVLICILVILDTLYTRVGLDTYTVQNLTKLANSRTGPGRVHLMLLLPGEYMLLQYNPDNWKLKGYVNLHPLICGSSYPGFLLGHRDRGKRGSYALYITYIT